MPSPAPLQPSVPPPHGAGVAFVTGAGGFIGSQVAAALEREGWRVAAFGRDGPAGDLDRAMLDQAAAALATPELVVHCAGAGSVAKAQDDPARDCRRTLGGLAEVLAFVRDAAPGARLILTSSAAVYGSGDGAAKSEQSPQNPVSVYGLHKQMAETMALSWARLYGLDLAVVRFFSVYGPGLRKQLFWDLHSRLAGDCDRLRLGGTGEERRDFLYIDDAVALIGVLAGRARQGEPLVVNGGSGRTTSVREAAETLVRPLSRPVHIDFTGEARAGNPDVLAADISRAKALGFQPRTSLEEGLMRYHVWLAGLGRD